MIKLFRLIGRLLRLGSGCDHCWHAIKGTHRKVPIRYDCKKIDNFPHNFVRQKEEYSHNSDGNTLEKINYVTVSYCKQCCKCDIIKEEFEDWEGRLVQGALDLPDRRVLINVTINGIDTIL